MIVSESYSVNSAISKLANDFCKETGATAIDGLHVAFAETYKKTFVSSDMKLLKKCRNSSIIRTEAMNPVAFLMEVLYGSNLIG